MGVPNTEPAGAQDHVSLGALRKAIPAHCMEPSVARSLLWLAFDMANVGGALYLHHACAQSALFQRSLLVQVATSLGFWAYGGLFMWALFVVGHDCGHGTFSRSPLVNHTCGLLAHGLLSVPYFPWRLSHYRHHQYHNHVVKDYSHPWSVGDGYIKEYSIRAAIPLVGWQLYLLGFLDGCHYVPLSTGRLFAQASAKEMFQCGLSTLVVAAYWWLLAACLGGLRGVCFFYVPSLAIFSWWIWTVTYLQHHDEHTKVYDDTTWSYARAAFETTDRTYGKGIETVTHHITDCHVVHHLFFNKIPHYHLREATDALVRYCAVHHPGLYRHVPTSNFATEVFRMFWHHAFDATLVSRKGE